MSILVFKMERSVVKLTNGDELFAAYLPQAQGRAPGDNLQSLDLMSIPRRRLLRLLVLSNGQSATRYRLLAETEVLPKLLEVSILDSILSLHPLSATFGASTLGVVMVLDLTQLTRL
jgi:hypothetical protein